MVFRLLFLYYPSSKWVGATPLLTSTSSPSSVEPDGKDEEQNPKNASQSPDEPRLLEQLLDLARDPLAILLGQISAEKYGLDASFNQ